MKKEKTNSILIYQYKLIDYMEKIINEQNQANIILSPKKEYSNLNADNIYKIVMENKIKYKNEIDKLIEDSRKELDIEGKIKKFREDMNKRNEERKMQDLIYEEKYKKFMEEMKFDEEYFKKRKEKMDLEYQNKFKQLEIKKKIVLEKERIEQNKRLEKIEKKRLEDEKKMQQYFDNENRLYKELEKKDKEIHEIKMQNIQYNKNLEQKNYEQLTKMSKDLTMQNKQILQMRNDICKIENEKKLLALEKDKLNDINQLNKEYIQYLKGQNEYMNNCINNYSNYNNFSDNNTIYYNNLAYSQPFPSNFN